MVLCTATSLGLGIFKEFQRIHGNRLNHRLGGQDIKQ
jgi:hypothetical protein